MQERLAYLLGAASVLGQIWVTPALADETFLRKPGLWEVRTSLEKSNAPPQVLQQCIDGATDRLLQSSAGPFSPAVCQQHTSRQSADSFTINSTCAVDGRSASAHSVVNGSFDDAYTMTVTAQSDALPGGRMVMSMSAKWLGSCQPDQKPGDVIMGSGLKMNIPDMERRNFAPH